MKFLVLLLIFAVLGVRCQDGDFVVPEALVQVYKPRGLRVSIPDAQGIRLFAFHANINEEMNGREGGTLSRDIVKAKDGRWTFYDPNIKLKVGDVLYYWTYVDYNDGERTLGFANDDQSFAVNELIPANQNQNQKPGQKPKGPTTTTTTTTTTTPPPRRTTAAHKPSTRPPQCAVKSETIVNGAHACKGQVIFEDNFVNLDNKKWKTEVKLASQPDYEFCTYVNFPEILSVKSGNLFIKPILSVDKFGAEFLNTQINLGRNCTGVPGTDACSKTAESYQILPPVLSGSISTKDSLNFIYGKVEIRAKLPRGKWLYPVLFLQPKNLDYGLDYDSGQMRIAYSAGNPDLGKQLGGGIILSSSEDGRTYGMRYSQSESLWSDSFHIYTLKWKPDGISVSVDGTTYGTVEPPEGGFASEANNIQSTAGERWSEGSPMAPFDKEAYLTMAVGVGGQNFPDSTPGKPYKNKSPKNILNFWLAKNTWFNTWSDKSAMQVDYVRITAL